MGKYGNSHSRYGDHDLELAYSSAETAFQLNNIANELAEANRLKKIELNLKFAELQHKQIKDNVPETTLSLNEISEQEFGMTKV